MKIVTYHLFLNMHNKIIIKKHGASKALRVFDYNFEAFDFWSEMSIPPKTILKLFVHNTDGSVRETRHRPEISKNIRGRQLVSMHEFVEAVEKDTLLWDDKAFGSKTRSPKVFACMTYAGVSQFIKYGRIYYADPNPFYYQEIKK